MKERYAIEIYEPGSTKNVSGFLESPTPFGAISRGDILNPQSWNLPKGTPGDPLLRVTGVEHLMWEANGTMKHKILLYTEEAPDTK